MGFVADESSTGRFVADDATPKSKYSPETLKAIEGLRAHGWGTGVPRLAYGAGETVTDVASKVPFLRGEPAAAAGFAANVATQAIPSLLSGRLAQEAGAPLLQSAGRRLMQSATKPTLQDLRTGDAAKGIETLLKEGYNPTKGGVAAMQARIDALGQEVAAAIKNSTAKIKTGDVGTRLLDAYNKFRQQVNPAADIEAVKRAWLEFRNHPDLVGKTEIPVQLAQVLKQGTYRTLGDKPYGELSGAATEAQKQLARGLKEEISAAVPSVAGLNAKQSELVNAAQLAERRALMSGNTNPVSFGWLANSPQAALGWMADKSDLVKALLARMLYSGSERIPQAAGSAAAAALMAPTGQPPTEQEMLAERLRRQ